MVGGYSFAASVISDAAIVSEGTVSCVLFVGDV
jgi:hypothetical protein